MLSPLRGEIARGAVFPMVFALLDHRLMANGKNPFGIKTLIAGWSVRTGMQRRLSRKTRQGVLSPDALWRPKKRFDSGAATNAILRGLKEI